MYYTYTSLFENHHNKVDLFFIVKTKLSSHAKAEVIEDDNNEVSKWGDVCQIDDIVKLNFHIVENTYIDVDEWNDILSISRHNEVEEGDEINKLWIQQRRW